MTPDAALAAYRDHIRRDERQQIADRLRERAKELPEKPCALTEREMALILAGWIEGGAA